MIIKTLVNTVSTSSHHMVKEAKLQNLNIQRDPHAETHKCSYADTYTHI